MFSYVAQDQHTFLKLGSFFLLQLHKTSRPVAAPMSLNFALKQQACLLQLHPTTWHAGYNCTLPACMSIRVASHQQICFNQLQLTCKHICSCGGWTSKYICYTCLRHTVMTQCSYLTNGLVSTIAPDMYVTAAPCQQPCLYNLLTVSMHVC